MHPLWPPQPEDSDRKDAPLHASGGSHQPPWHWHLFCQVIDNWGDIGVSWRLARDLAGHGHTVTLWLDDASALAWMAPQETLGIQVAPWPMGPSFSPPPSQWPDRPSVVIEMFGCHLSEGVQRYMGRRHDNQETKPEPLVWINLEYLSAEPHVHDLHRLPSPVMSGPAAGMTKWFFYPGFSAHTGGLIHPGTASEAPPADQTAYSTTCSLFCYPSPALRDWVRAWVNAGFKVATWPGIGANAVDALGLDHVIRWKAVTQPEFDDRLSQCVFNVVRGEDSLSRALWTGKPFLWHIYPQSDGAHLDKLSAFLDWSEAPEPVRQAHRIWNGIEAPPNALGSNWVPTPLSADWTQWLRWADSVQAKAQQIPNLSRSLLNFVHDLTRDRA